MDDKIEFIAIMKQVSMKALVSGDKSARITLETEDLGVSQIGTWPGDETVTVTIVRNKSA